MHITTPSGLPAIHPFRPSGLVVCWSVGLVVCDRFFYCFLCFILLTRVQMATSASVSSASASASPVKRKRTEIADEPNPAGDTSSDSDVWGLCRWRDYIYIDSGGGLTHESEEDRSLLLTKKLFDMIDNITYTWLTHVEEEVESKFDGRFTTATPEEIAVLKKFNCILGGREFIEDILDQQEDKKSKEWFNAAQIEFKKAERMNRF
jgi:hypothetical protein